MAMAVAVAVAMETAFAMAMVMATATAMAMVMATAMACLVVQTFPLALFFFTSSCRINRMSSVPDMAGTHTSVNRFRNAGDNSRLPKSPPFGGSKHISQKKDRRKSTKHKNNHAWKQGKK
jgi:hypothetical protein